MYLETAEGDSKEWFYNQRYHPFKICENHQRNIKFKPNLVWSIAKTIPPYYNISKKCLLHKKLEIINYPRPQELLNKTSGLISKCRDANKFLYRNYKTKHWVQSFDYIYNPLYTKTWKLHFWLSGSRSM